MKTALRISMVVTAHLTLLLALAAPALSQEDVQAEAQEEAEAEAVTGQDEAAQAAADETTEAAAAASDDETAADTDEASSASVSLPAPRSAESDSESADEATFDFISDGTRIELKEKELTIVPPRGWEIYTKQPNLTLLMQVPFDEGLKYQRTIQVAAFSGSRFIDEVTAKEYEEIIVRKFSEASIVVADYRIRNHMTIEMADGRPGLLFYSEFNIDGVDLMQAHILVSSQERHFLLTYTDLAAHFEDENANQFLTEAWESMISVELSGRTPARFESVAVFGMAAVGVVLLGLSFWGLRNWQAGRKYRDYSDGRGLDDVEATTRDSVALEPLTSGALASEDPQSIYTGDTSKIDRKRRRSEAADISEHGDIATGSSVSFLDEKRARDDKKTDKKGKQASQEATTGYNAGLDDDQGSKISNLDDDEDLAV